MKKKLLLVVPFFVISLGVLSCSCGNNTSSEDYEETFTQNGIKYLGVHHDNTNLASVIGFDDNLPNEIDIPSKVQSKYQYEVNMIAYKSFQYSGVEKVKLPETINYIGYSSFSGCTSLKTIELPSSLSKINKYTFAGCSSLENIVLPIKCETIDSYAFYGCSSLKNVTLNDNLTYLGAYSFSDCTLIENISLPSKVYRIDEGAFYSCTSLNQVYLPDSLTLIDSLAFYKCSSLENIFIPKSVTYIGSKVFEYTSSKLTILLERSDVPSLFSTNFNCYRPYALGTTRATKVNDVFITDATSKLNYVINNYLDNENSYSIILSNSDSQEIVTVPETITYGENTTSKVTSIDDLAFYQDTNIKTLDLSSAFNLNNIGKNSFAKCTSLTSINNISSATSLKTIGRSAFYGCTGLSTLNIESTSLESIGEYCFSDISGNNGIGLTSVDLSKCSKLSYLGRNTFKNDYNLTTVTLPINTTNDDASPLTLIGSGCFNYCTKLNTITNLDKIEKLVLLGDTFNSCYSLGIDENKPFNLTSNFSIITSTDFKNWGTVNAQYIKVSKDAYSNENDVVTLNAKNEYGENIVLNKTTEEGKYYNSEYFGNAIITLEISD